MKPEVKKHKTFDWGETRSHHKKPVLPEPEEYSQPSEPKVAENDLPGFIKLTRKRSDREGMVDLLIRPEAIESVCVGVDGFTILNGNRYYAVKETPEEIFKILKGK